MAEELELNDDQLARNDEIDNAVYTCLQILTENDDLEWDMSMIGPITDEIKDILLRDHNIHVRHPGICTDENGVQTYEE